MSVVQTTRRREVSESSSLLDENVASHRDTDMRLGKCWASSRHFQVDVLAGLFGISAWLLVNALFTQLPILVETAPEGWNLPSYLSILIQLANIAPVVYGFAHNYFPGRVSDSKLIYLILMLGSSSLILMAFYYSNTIVVFGSPHSVILFVLVFCMAIVGCISSVLFIPFMNNYPEIYLTSYMVGEGFSGFLPSMVSFLQGVGGNPTCVNSTSPSGEIIETKIVSPPRFSSEVFFLIIFAIMVVSTVSFYLLNNLPACKSQKVKTSLSRERSGLESPAAQDEPDPFVPPTRKQNALTPFMYRTMLIFMTVLSMFANGALPSIQSYSCLPYGNVAYHLAVNLGHIANPIACAITFFETQRCMPRIFVTLCLSVVVVVYLFVTAVLSPHPPLQDSQWGLVLIVLAWVACSGLISYTKMSIASIFRQEEGKGLFWFGSFTQLGAAIGSGFMFYLINYRNIFTSYDPCR